MNITIFAITVSMELISCRESEFASHITSSQMRERKKNAISMGNMYLYCSGKSYKNCECIKLEVVKKIFW